MAKKKTLNEKASKKRNIVSKSQNRSNSDKKNISPTKKEQKNKTIASSHIPEEGNLNTYNNATLQFSTKKTIFGVLLLTILASVALYFFQSYQNITNTRNQELIMEKKLEKLQLAIADKLNNDQNNNIEKINQDLNKILDANELLSKQNQSLVDQISKLTKSTDMLTENPSREKNTSLTRNKEYNEIETKKLLMAIKKAQETVESLESALKKNEAEKNISVNLSEILQALNEGRPFWVQLSKVAAELNLKLSENIKQKSILGIKTVDDLQESFPPYARNVLKGNTHLNNELTMKDKAISYLKSHITTRSLKPISGNSVDAILSRAEMNLRLNNLEKALFELNSLSEDSKKIMENWLAEARTNLKVKRELRAIFETAKNEREHND